jgi:hypothetical protein
MEKTSYRLERVIAFVLSLLFFLPFVARAEEILLTGTFHEGEVRQRSADDWLALVDSKGGWMLQPARVEIAIDHDPIVDEDGEKSGRTVTAIAVDDPLLLVRGERVSPGQVTAARPDAADLSLDGTSVLTFGGTRYALRFRCGDEEDEFGFTECALLLVANGYAQPIATFAAQAWEEGKLAFAGDVRPSVLWAGDLDRDGRLDLLLDASWHYNVFAPTLYLSSAAKEGQLVAKVATFRSAGC